MMKKRSRAQYPPLGPAPAIFNWTSPLPPTYPPPMNLRDEALATLRQLLDPDLPPSVLLRAAELILKHTMPQGEVEEEVEVDFSELMKD